MKLSLYARLAARESRRSTGRILLFAACIAVGVAAVVAVAGLSAGVNEGIRSQGRRLMAADVTVEGRRPLPPELDAALAAIPPAASGERVRRTDVREFVSVVAGAGDRSQLAELKAVDGEYPFYGTLALDPPRPLRELLAPDAVVVAPELLDRLGLQTGGTLKIGGAPFRIAGVVVEEPDKLSATFALGPRVFLSGEGLSRTALQAAGSRIEHRALLKLPEGVPVTYARRLADRLKGALPGDTYRVRPFTEAQPQLRQSFDRMGRYLGLVGLLSLLVGGVGVAQVSRAWVAARTDDIAVMRCLGVRPNEVVVLFLAQVVALATLASLLGAAAGTALHALAPRLMGDLLPADLIRPWQPAAVLRGVLLGVAVAVVFTLPLLAGLRRVPPVRVLRRDAEAGPAGRAARLLGAAVVLGGVWALATAQAESVRYGSLFAAGVVASVGLLALAAAGISRLARLLPQDAGGLRLRHGLRHLARPGAATVGSIVAIGLGVTFVFATRVVERHLTDQLSAELPADAPSTFFIDVQPDQWPGLSALLTREGAAGVDSRPIVTGRFAAIDGVPVRDRAAADRAAAPPAAAATNPPPGGNPNAPPRPRTWALTREQRVTYGDALPRGNRVTSGAFPAPPGTRNGISIEEGFANDLGVRVGSTLTLDVQGVPVEMTVASLRTVDWRTLGINFFLFAEPGPLDDAPQQRVAVARIERPDVARVQSAVVTAFPNVTVIHVRDVMDRVLVVLGGLGLAVKALGGFTVVAGVVVLGGTVAATQARRSREVALLKTLGMTRRDVVVIFATEYALTGLTAATIGLAAAALLAWAVLTQLMKLPWSPSWKEFATAAAITVTLSTAAGLAASARALAAKPLTVLRAD